MDNIKRYDPEDFIELQSWYKKRGINFDDSSLLPSVGFIVPGVGAGFIYVTDSSVYFIEGFITNPDASKDNRNESLDLITVYLISYSKAMNCKIIKCETSCPEIELRGMKHGFKCLGKVTSLVKEL